jgi:hypothetical protein
VHNELHAEVHLHRPNSGNSENRPYLIRLYWKLERTVFGSASWIFDGTLSRMWTPNRTHLSVILSTIRKYTNEVYGVWLGLVPPDTTVSFSVKPTNKHVTQMIHLVYSSLIVRINKNNYNRIVLMPYKDAFKTYGKRWSVEPPNAYTLHTHSGLQESTCRLTRHAWTNGASCWGSHQFKQA